ncbi:MAG: hypothetical protein NZM12_12845, partial [Steroidobacteraceae bacterium]|nr:hypothetical protein [Steroidobacteraceae bacterium]MDW8259604.1 AAA+ family ATPase [Gammaproteobacteria bacterium]
PAHAGSGATGAVPLGASLTDAPPGGAQKAPGAPSPPRRYHATVQLDPARVGRDAARVAEEVIAHLAGQPGAEIVVTLEIDARLPQGANEHTVRTVIENGTTLKFISHGFERD